MLAIMVLVVLSVVEPGVVGATKIPGENIENTGDGEDENEPYSFSHQLFNYHSYEEVS